MELQHPFRLPPNPEVALLLLCLCVISPTVFILLEHEKTLMIVLGFVVSTSFSPLGWGWGQAMLHTCPVPVSLTTATFGSLLSIFHSLVRLVETATPGSSLTSHNVETLWYCGEDHLTEHELFKRCISCWQMFTSL